MFYTITQEDYNNMGLLLEYKQREYVVVLNSYGNKVDIATYNPTYENIVVTTIDSNKLTERVVL